MSVIKNKNYNCCNINIQSGSGGIDSKDWINILTKMYIKWANINNLKINIISNYNISNYKNKLIILKAEGKYSFELFKTESGIHRLVRKSPFDSWKRHTSFASVSIYKNEIENKKNLNINVKDLKIDYYKSSGPGGQHVNKTKSSVRITHLPTGIISKSNNRRSQHKNKDCAINKLKIKLNNMEVEKIKIDKKKMDSCKLDISWGNHIRSYILDNSLIKDYRTGIKTQNIKSVLNGNLNIFIKKK